jgi:hypothetical protein
VLGDHRRELARREIAGMEPMPHRQIRALYDETIAVCQA